MKKAGFKGKQVRKDIDGQSRLCDALTLSQKHRKPFSKSFKKALRK